MPLSDDFLMELHQKVDIESVVSPYVTLKRKGKLLGGLCPFHNEKTPSFYVYPDTQSYYCFGCGNGGDVITFIKNIEHLDYIEAVKFICERNGIDMPEDGYDTGLHNNKRRLYEANREAARFYYKMLFEPCGKIARDYCNFRQLKKETVTHFGIGYAPDDWHTLKNYLNSKGFTDNELLQADLIKRSQKGNCYDSFRNRLMFPIVDLRGNVLGFSGRRLNEEEHNKYINTTDTLIYKKGREVFGLNFAKKGNTDKLILCEGNIDVVMLHQAGFTNAVACLGTALTSEQAQTLSRYTGEILLCYDNDEPGQEAVRKALRVFADTTVKIKVITMAGGKDPDEIIKKYGVDRFRSLIEGAANDTEYKLHAEMHKYDLLTNDGKVSFMKAAAVVLSELDNAVELDVYASDLAEKLNVNKAAIISEVEKNRRKNKYTKRREQFREIQKAESNPRDPKNKVNPERRDNLRAARCEETIIALLMSCPTEYKKIKNSVSYTDFITEFNSRVFKVICDRLEEDKPVDLPFLAQSFSDDELSVIAGFTANARAIGLNPDDIESCIKAVKEEKDKNTAVKPSEMSDEQFLKLFSDKQPKEDDT